MIRTLMAAGLCLALAGCLWGCKTRTAGQARVGVGWSSTWELYFFHVAERSAEQTGEASAELDVQPAVDYWVTLNPPAAEVGPPAPTPPPE